MLSRNYNWWTRGLFLAAFMYLFLVVLKPLSENRVATIKELLLGIPFWGISCLLYYWISDYFFNKKKSKGV